LKKAAGQRSSDPTPPREVTRLRQRLAEAEETLRAIRSGEVDAVVVAGKQGPQVFTLQGAEHAYRLLIESMNEGALTLTTDKTILYANQCFARMVKCPLEQVTGSSFRRFLSDEDQATLHSLLKQVDKSGAKIQMVVLTGDGSKIPVQISLRPLAKNGSDHAAIGIVVTDMTEARRAAEQQETVRLYEQMRVHAAELEHRVDERTQQLLSANQELESFESSVSHDLRSPLRSINGFSHILIQDYGPQLPETALGYLKKIRDSAEKMECLITALLNFSRFGKQALSLQSVDVGRMCREVLAEMIPVGGDPHLEVTIGDLPACYADPTLLRQVLVNLISNALKYSQKRAHAVIQISTVPQPDGGPSAYSIKDNGIGFNMVSAGKLFTLFQRLDSAREFEGTGVGLSTAHRIIQRHEGRIWAESAPDAGATFFFTVGSPISPSAAPAASVELKTEANRPCIGPPEASRLPPVRGSNESAAKR
jgi:PAS domain S-box-containing protein